VSGIHGSILAVITGPPKQRAPVILCKTAADDLTEKVSGDDALHWMNRRHGDARRPGDDG
jgi:hypothetical protein